MRALHAHHELRAYRFSKPTEHRDGYYGASLRKSINKQFATTCHGDYIVSNNYTQIALCDLYILTRDFDWKILIEEEFDCI